MVAFVAQLVKVLVSEFADVALTVVWLVGMIDVLTFVEDSADAHFGCLTARASAKRVLIEYAAYVLTDLATDVVRSWS